MHQHPL
ncbi:hypothetical protein D030_5195A, partial [Vibrio parahaemolyticus AQ3810]